LGNVVIELLLSLSIFPSQLPDSLGFGLLGVSFGGEFVRPFSQQVKLIQQFLGWVCHLFDDSSQVLEVLPRRFRSFGKSLKLGIFGF
jgi:hypothetical protein